MKIRTQIHTIFMMVGPTASGKTTFTKMLREELQGFQVQGNKNFEPNIQMISSDEIRREILGVAYDKMDNVMTESSEQAFELLFTKLKMVTSYPINAEFVILDTTGLSTQFRNDVIEIAQQNNYNLDVVVFDYKKIDEYKKTFENQEIGSPTKLIAKHVKRLKTEVLRTLKSGKNNPYKNIHKIKSKDFIQEEEGIRTSNLEVNVWDWQKYESCILSNDFDWINIGDVHGCINSLKELLIRYGFKIENNKIIDTDETKNKGIILVGDIVDKSSEKDIKETIEFVHLNKKLLGERLQLIMGNHEEMVWKWITDHPRLEKTEKRLEEKEKYYNTVGILENSPYHKELFLELFSEMKGWYKQIGSDKKSFICTHAPCEVKYLEKMDGKSLHKQVVSTSRSKNKDLSLDELLPYLMEEAVKNHPIHIFGHLGQERMRTFKNKVCIDTGCVYGGNLIGYSVTGHSPFIQKVNSHNSTDRTWIKQELFAEVHKHNSDVSLNDLNNYNQRRLDYIVKNGIGYIGGTISPADKDEEKNTLESLEQGLNHYKGNVDKVVLQPKYMGSRAQLYLNKDLKKCYATSRNGYKIKTDLGNLLEDELKKHTPLMEELGAKELVLDGELMPWSALGRGLIEKEFMGMDRMIKNELDFLKENGFDEAFLNLKEDYEQSDFKVDKNNMNKKELNKKYGHQYHNFKNLPGEIDRFQPLEMHEEAWKIYHEQVEIYGADTPIHYKAFRILKAIDDKGNRIEINWSPDVQFGKVNDDEICVIDFKTNLKGMDYLEIAQEWYKKLTEDKKMEGCVIKPIGEAKKFLAPFLKVRNEKYLSIVYGYDYKFPRKFEKLIRQKNIKRKVRASINEYHLGEQMLNSELGSKEQKQIIANMLFENEKEVGIDPRL